ncbi:hypothetical protein ACJVDH_14775 [Pedobacter sp. AW1-32]|uniref:hypothetical protein n=1 Tax=Pedobacter sp. AW1-32 TaxID=3383026 RepID=UPI003FEF5508
MKKIILGVLFILSMHCSFSQIVHTDLRTPTWNVIGLRYDAELSPGKWGSVFPAKLKALNKKQITLPGYMIPTKVGEKFSQFLLSIVPIASCPYCGSGDIPSMIEVKMAKPVAITERPIKITGIFQINASGDDRSEFFLLNAKLTHE